MHPITKKDWFWTHAPKEFTLTDERIEIVTSPHTDLWQRTYYHFRNDNAPLLQMRTEEAFFSFVVKTEFAPARRFDQCGVVVYLDSENWLKASAEYENGQLFHLGSVVTNGGFSDWATQELAPCKCIWYRLSRRQDDFRIESSLDGIHFAQMRVCHLAKAQGEISFGIYACSPEESSFRAVFSELSLLPCQWLAHDGQAPDEEA